MVEDARGELPPMHDSTEPVEPDWVLIGYKVLDEDKRGNHGVLDQCYLALYSRQTGEDLYRFRFQWRHSDHLLQNIDGEDHPVDEYGFAGMVYRQNGNEYTLLWDAGVIRQTGTFVTTSHESDDIEIRSWFGVCFLGSLMAHYTIERSYWEKALGYTIMGLAGLGFALSYSPASFGVTAGILILVTWRVTEWLDGDTSTTEYHDFFGRLDILDSPESCILVNATYGQDQGYDIPDIIEDNTGRRNTGEYGFWVRAVFPSKIHLDICSLIKDQNGHYSDQSETEMLFDSGRIRYRIIGFPDTSEHVHFSLDQKTMELDWDLSNYFNTNDGLLNSKTREYLLSGDFLPEDEIYDYYALIGAKNWDVPVLNFEIVVSIDYELPEIYDSHYPADFIGSIYEDQALITAVDYYSLGYTGTEDRIKIDCFSEYRVLLGDETTPALILLPFLPIIIGYQMLREGGIFIDMPDEFDDYYIIPPDQFDVVYKTDPENSDPDDMIAVREPGAIVEDVSINDSYYQDYLAIGNHPIVVPDPEDTVFIKPAPGIIPESFAISLPDFAVNKENLNSAEGCLESYRSLLENHENYDVEMDWNELDTRRDFTVRALPGVPHANDVLRIPIHDVAYGYQLVVNLPDDFQMEILTINPLKCSESCSFTIKNIPAVCLVPGSSEFEDLTDKGTTIDLPHEDDGVYIEAGGLDAERDSVSLISVPEPERHIIIDADMSGMYASNHLTVSVLTEGTTDHERTFNEMFSDLDPSSLCIANLVQVTDSEVSICTTVPEELLPIQNSIRHLDNDDPVISGEPPSDE